MNHEILQTFSLSQDILLVLYTHHEKKMPAFVLKAGFQAALFVPAPEPVQTAAIELTLDADVWQTFQASCAELGITPDACLNAWLSFAIKPESYEAVKKFLKEGRRTEREHF